MVQTASSQEGDEENDPQSGQDETEGPVRLFDCEQEIWAFAVPCLFETP